MWNAEHLCRTLGQSKISMENLEIECMKNFFNKYQLSLFNDSKEIKLFLKRQKKKVKLEIKFTWQWIKTYF